MTAHMQNVCRACSVCSSVCRMMPAILCVPQIQWAGWPVMLRATAMSYGTCWSMTSLLASVRLSKILELKQYIYWYRYVPLYIVLFLTVCPWEPYIWWLIFKDASQTLFLYVQIQLGTTAFGCSNQVVHKSWCIFTTRPHGSSTFQHCNAWYIAKQCWTWSSSSFGQNHGSTYGIGRCWC